MDQGVEEFVDRLAEIAKVVNSFDSPEVQLRVLDAILAVVDAEYAEAGSSGNVGSSAAAAGAVPAKEATAKKAPAKKSNVGKAVGKKSSSKKQTFTLDKTLDLYKPTPTFLDFVGEKKPSNVKDKALVAVYWLQHHSGTSPATVDHVYTCFKAADWPIPADLVNTLQQAGSAGTLHSADREDLSVTTHGENRVEHELPAKG